MRKMKIYQYNPRIQYWYDRSVRVWLCATNNLNGATTCASCSSYRKIDILEDCKDLEEELQNDSTDFHSKNFSERKWEHETHGQRGAK
jgi:hypothetical protein